MTHEDIEAYLKTRDLDVMQYQLAMDAMCYAENVIIGKVLDFINTYFYDHPHLRVHICTDYFESLEQMQEELIKAMEE